MIPIFQSPRIHWLPATAAALLFAFTLSSAAAGADPLHAIAHAVASDERPATDRERDARDRPAEVLAFLGLQPGMTVFDLDAAAGYYTELLSRAVGPRGHVIAHNHPGAVAMLGAETLARRYGDGRLANVERLVLRHQDLHPAPGSLDMVLMSMVYHDLYWYDPKVDWGPVDPVALLENLRAALKPGGVVGIIDNVAETDTDPKVAAMALHRIDPETVRRDFQQAGFVLEAESSLLRNTTDDHRLSVFDPMVHGHTDRFVMRFRRP